MCGNESSLYSVTNAAVYGSTVRTNREIVYSHRAAVLQKCNIKVSIGVNRETNMAEVSF